MPSDSTTPSSGAFRWICFVTAALFGIALLTLVWDLKRGVSASLAEALGTITEANEAIAQATSRRECDIAGV